MLRAGSLRHRSAQAAQATPAFANALRRGRQNTQKKQLPAGMSYGKFPVGYQEKMRPYVDRQLEKAGVRLAWVLEESFGK
jgi:hypothetical protein